MRLKMHLLWFTTLGHFTHHITLYLFPAIVIFIRQDITSLDYFQIGLLGTLPILIMAIISPGIGKLGEQAKLAFPTLIIGVVLFVVSCVLLSISQNFWDLFIANVILGLGAATYHPIGLAIVSNSFVNKTRGKALSINHAFGVIGTAFSPVISILITLQVNDWRITAFIFAIVLSLIFVVMLSWQVLKHLIKGYQNTEISITEEKARKAASNQQTSLFDQSKRFLLITIIMVLLIGMLRSGIYRSLSYFTVTLLKDFYLLSELEAGFWTSMILLVGSVSDVGGAIISDKFGPQGRVNILVLSAIATGISISLLILAPVYSEFIIILILFCLFAISFYLAGGTLQALQADLIPAESRSVFYSVVFSLGLIVSSVTPSIFGGLLDIFKQPAAPFMFLLVLTILTLSILWFFKRRLIHLQNTDQLSS